MTAGAHDEFDLALVETQYRDAIRSLVAATGLAATYQDERDHALAALARVRALCDVNAGVATRDGALMVSTIRKALEGTS